ncbi:hypothetical protein M2D07_006505 [Pseudomonas sp. BGr12]|uniref:hypothetical protein n=1 Tax=Pseudomonas sp. BGr12 TaxID=2936269 RepID=UPI002559D1AC|nr:hypothetical protein [Pseudomonas sp. BJa5]MDL2426666.1 hypothetical protein [Pseudomonas sp. BJa5]
MWTDTEPRRRARFQGAQTAYDLRSDPLWDGPDPEPDDEQAAEDSDPPDLEGL